MLHNELMKKNISSLTHFIIAEALSLFSQSAFMLVLPWLILAVTGSVAHASIVTTIATIPSIVVSLASGFVIDRIGRRRSSIIATLGCAVAAIGLAATATTGTINVAWLIGLGLFANLFLIPGMTARDTLMADVATASGTTIEKLAGMRQLVFSIAFLAGPGFAGLLMTHASPSFVLWIISGLWIIAALFTHLLPKGTSIPQPHVTEKQPSLWRRALKTPALALPLLIGFGTCLITAPVNDVLIPAHFRAINEPQLFGLAMSIFAAGSLAGAALYMVLIKNARLAYVTSVVMITIGFIGLALLPTFWVLAGALFLIGVGANLSSPFLIISVTMNTEEHERGRMMGLFNTLSLGAAPVGLALLSFLLQYTDIQAGLITVLAVWTIIAVIMLVGGKRIYTVTQDETETTHN